MKEDKHSDQVFREKLENFSVDPPVHVWEGIQDQLLRNKKANRIVFLRWISAAAAILIAFLGGWYFNNNNTGIVNEIAGVEEIASPIEKDSEENINDSENNIIPVVPEENLIVTAENIEKEEKKTEIKVVASNKPEAKIMFASSENNNRIIEELEFLERRKIKLNSTINSANSALRYKRSFSTIDKLSEYDRALIARNSGESKSINEDESTWKLGMMVSPGYSSQVANHSDVYASNMTYTVSEGNTNVTGGISVQLKTSKRLSIESGVYYDKNGQKSENSLQLFAMSNKNEDMYYDAGAGSGNYFSNNVQVKDGNLQMNSNAGIVALNSVPNGAEFSSDIESVTSAVPKALVTSGDLSQVFDFVQIPLYMRYKIIDSKIDVEMIGGFNAGMLVGNNAYINNEYGSQNIGKTENISPLSISGTLGFGVNYELGKHFSLAAEPRINYFLSSINKSTDVTYKPYRIGFYTGIYYEF